MPLNLKITPKAVSADADEDQRLARQYQKMDMREHVLERPGVYIGPVTYSEDQLFIVDSQTDQMVKTPVKYVPGLYKIYDEVLVNAYDQYIRVRGLIERQTAILEGRTPDDGRVQLDREYQPVRNIKVNINPEEGTISVYNDGDGIDIAIHPTEGIFVPQMIFGNLLTSTNFDKDEKRVVGGQNGEGAKLANIFSTEFTVETVDYLRKQVYTQTFRDNMTVTEEPIIRSCHKKPYTRITFKPDLPRFGLTSLLDDQTVDLMKKRVYDIAGCCNDGVKVYFNDTQIKIKNFERYVDKYIGTRGEWKRVYAKINDDWEIAVCLSPERRLEHVSFVNGVWTFRGGRHVEHVKTIICKRLLEYIKTANKKGMGTLTEKSIGQNLWIFVNAVIENPSFDTQTKENLTTGVRDFRSTCDIPPDVIERLAKTEVGILQRASDLAKLEEHKVAERELKKRTTRIKSDKLYEADAVLRGTSAQRMKSTLILVEGDSASSYPYKGLRSLSEDDRRYWGILTLRGKCINPRDKPLSKVSENQEFALLKQTLGLEMEKDYTSDRAFQSLRYGRVMIMTDADVDGSHIEGLILNIFHHYWPSLIKRRGFLCSFMNPILMVNYAGQTLKFYSDQSFRQWRLSLPAREYTRVKPKYYKGLGTYDPAEVLDNFREMTIQTYQWNECPEYVQLASALKQMVDDGTLGVDYLGKYYRHFLAGDPNDCAIEIGFSDKLADLRKGWILHYLGTHDDPGSTMFHDKRDITPYEVMTEKIVCYSVENCVRSIPHLMDGLKPSQRKIIYTMLKKKITKPTKVVSIVGRVLDVSAYHHSDSSLAGALVKMAQMYSGSNNLNLLSPIGEFGNRIKNGSNSADPRYISTCLEPIALKLFNSLDQYLYRYLDDDGMLIEPEYYAPILPLILINGASGIGTGWSSNVPMYNPLDVYHNVCRYCRGEPLVHMDPFYQGYTGTITRISDRQFRVRGVYTRIDELRVRITEIPIGYAKDTYSYDDYASFIHDMAYPDSGTGTVSKTGRGRGRTSKQIASSQDTIIADYSVQKDDLKLDMTLVFHSESQLDDLLESPEQFEKTFKLSVDIVLSNMELYMPDDSGIRRFVDELDILSTYCHYRTELYDLRKQDQIAEIRHQILKLENQIRFISGVIDNTIQIRHPDTGKPLSKDELGQCLIDLKFPPLSFKRVYKMVNQSLDKVEDDHDHDPDPDLVEGEDEVQVADEEGNYSYLLNIKISECTQTHLDRLASTLARLKIDLDLILSQTPQDIWLDDLKSIDTMIANYQTQWYQVVSGNQQSSGKGKGKGVRIRKSK